MKIIKKFTFAILAALTATLLFQAPTALAGDNGNHGRPSDPFVILLKGIYQPIGLGEGPKHNLRLSEVDLSDSSYSKTTIYGVSGLPGHSDGSDKAIGTFYVQFTGMMCAYDLPGGS